MVLLMVDVLAFPKVNGRISTPGAPGLRRFAQMLHGSPAPRLEQSQVSGRESIGPAQGSHGDILGGPVADPGKGLELADDGLGVGAGFQVDLASGDGPSDGPDARRCAARRSPGRSAPLVRQTPTVSGVGLRRVSPGTGVSSGSPKRSASRPARVVAARTEMRWPRMARIASSKPSNAPGTRNPGQRATTRASRESTERCAAITSGPRAQIKQVFQTARGLPAMPA